MLTNRKVTFKIGAKTYRINVSQNKTYIMEEFSYWGPFFFQK